MSTRHTSTGTREPANTTATPDSPAQFTRTPTARSRMASAREERGRFPLRLYTPVRNIVIAEVITAVIAGVMVWRALSWHWMVAAAATVFLIAFVAFKDASLTHWAVTWWRWWRHRKSKHATQIWTTAPPPIVDVALPNREGVCGVRWDGDVLITAVELTARRHTPTVLADGMAITEDVVPMQEVAKCLWQYDINLIGIDLASAGRRVAPGTAYAGSYDQLIGVKPGLTARRTWMILRLRFDPDDPGIRNRGGGIEGAVNAAVAATRRARRRLREANCLAVIADAASLRAAHTALAAGLDPEDIHIERGTLATSSGFVTTYRLHPDDLTNVHLGAWWAHRCVSAAVIIRITPGTKRGEVHLRTWVRHVCKTRPKPSDRLPGLIRQYGDQTEALTATLPLGEHSWAAQRRIVSSPQSITRVEALAGLHIQVGAGGQLIGSTPTGHPLLLPLAERGILTRVYVDAPIWVAQQLVLRALAGGASARVNSSRPEAWWPMIRRLAEPRRLWLSHSENNRVGTIQVCDHAPITYPSGAETLLILGNAQAVADADILVRLDRHSGQVTVTVGEGPARPVTLDATKEETRYLGRLD